MRSDESEPAKLSGIIPACGSVREVKQFLASQYGVGVLMNVHIALLDGIFARARECGKELLLHLDMIRGLASDEYGCEYACQRYRPAAGISIRSNVIAALKRKRVTAIQRVFLVDTLALEKSVESVARAEPDYVEVLPGMCVGLLPMLHERLGRPMIAGGLIPSREAAERVLADPNVSAVTINISRVV